MLLQMAYSRNRTAMRMDAKMRLDAREEEEEFGSHLDMLKQIGSLIDENGQFIPAGPEEKSELEEQFDAIPDDSEKLEKIYNFFKMPGLANLLREEAMNIMNGVIKSEGGRSIIKSLVNKNKLKKICSDLLRDLRNETVDGVKWSLSRVILNIAIRRKDGWPELIRFMENCASSSDHCQQKMVLELYGNCEPSCVKIGNVPIGNQDKMTPLAVGWSTFKNLIVSSILNSDSSLRVTAMNVLCQFIGTKTKDDKEMMETLGKLAPILVKDFEKGCCPVKCDGEHLAALDCLHEIAIDAPKVIRDKVEEIFTMCTKIILRVSGCTRRDIRHTALQLMTTVGEKYGPLVPAGLFPDIVTSGLLSIYNGMDDNVDEWIGENPLKGEETKGRDWGHIIGNWYFAKIAVAIGAKKISPHLISIAQQFLKDGDWEKRAAALIGLTVVGESFHRLRTPSIIDCVLTVVDDTNIRVRYYAFFLFSRIVLKHNLNNHPNRVEKVLSALCTALSDSVPRIVSIGVAVLSNVLFAISENEDFPQDFLEGNYDSGIPLLMSIIEGWEGDEESRKYYPSCAFEVISFFAEAVGKDRFSKDFPKVTASIGRILESFSSADLDNPTEFAIASERICDVMGADCTPFLDLLMNTIYQKEDGSEMLKILIEAVDTDDSEDVTKNVELEKKVAPYVKIFCTKAECIEGAELSDDERETLKRILAHSEM